jgi:hypothetical protein
MPQSNCNPQIVGNVGLYHVCYKLSTLGWNVMPTARNARGVDIICYNSHATKFFGIQVKSLSKRSSVPLGKTLDKVMGDFWVVVSLAKAEPTAFVLSPDEVQKLGVVRTNTKGEASYWLQAHVYESDLYKEAWVRIGRGDDPDQGDCLRSDTCVMYKNLKGGGHGKR